MKKTKIYNVQRVRFRKDELILVVDERKYHFKLEDISRKLLKARKKERELFEITPSGYGIHWPLIDEDLSIKALLKTVRDEATTLRS